MSARIYGTAALQDGKWHIEVQPHAAIRLKRMFGGSAKQVRGRVVISATADNCRDLEWFSERYPLEFNPEDVLLARASEHRERESLVDDLLEARRPATAFDLAVPARDYQKMAATMALATGGLLLADDVGLGKTCSAICMLADPRTIPALFVCLTHLPVQIEREVNRFAPRLKTHIIAKGTPYDLTETSCGGRKRRHLVGWDGQKCVRCGATGPCLEQRTPDVLIINYHKLAGWDDVLAPLVRTVIYDEVQELRHKGSQRYGAAMHISEHATFRLGLSATPIYNYGAEIYNVLEAIRPTALGSMEEFTREWCGYASCDEKTKIADPKAFGMWAKEQGLMLRRSRRDVGRELPPLTRVPHYIDTEEDPLRQVDGAARLLAQRIVSQESTKEERFLAAGEFDIMLRKATGVAKAPHVAAFAEMLLESEEKVVLYGWHRAVYDVWLKQLAHFSPVLYTGSESPHQKEASKARFILPNEEPYASRVMIISLRAGAGLDGLQHVCRTVVFGELDWSPGVHEQCVGRVFRDGQPEPVMAYYLIAESGSDPVVADVLGVKRQQIAGLRDEGGLVEELEVDEHRVRRLAEAYLAEAGA